MTAPAKVTVVTVVFNAAGCIADNIRSVAAQTHAQVEHLIIDGASTDGTLDIVRGLAHPRLVLRSGPDRGIYDAMNKGIAQAGGEWLVFLNADDILLEPTTIADALARIAPAGPAEDSIHFFDFVMFSRISDLGRQRVTSTLDLRRGMSMNHQSMLYHASVFRRVGGYRDDLRLSGDAEHAIRCFRQGVRFVHHAMPFAGYCLDGRSSTQGGRYLGELLPIIRDAFGRRAAFALWFNHHHQRLSLAVQRRVGQRMSNRVRAVLKAMRRRR